MIKDVFIALEEELNKLKEKKIIKYVAEDWGQLDYYQTRPPVDWACVLFDVADADYSDRGERAQDGVGWVMLRIADYSPVNRSSSAPDNTCAFELIDILTEVYKAVQGLSGETFTPLTRKKLRKVRRDDGIREFEMLFKFGFVDFSAMRTKKAPKPDIKIN